jgi:energy-coupling factor transport system ATP-binding protein
MKKKIINKTRKFNITDSAITLKNFSIIFNQGLEEEYVLFDKINYSFEKGKIHFIVGPSGSGKTVLVSHFNGLIKSTNGEIIINGSPIIFSGKKIVDVKKIRSKIGAVFQFAEYQLFKNTIENDIIFGPMNFGMKKDKAKIVAKEVMKKVGMPLDFLSKNPFGISGGQKRRVAIAGVLASDPNILIFDEPTAGLDPNGEKEILKIITDLKKEGKTIIVVTHTMNHAIEIADNLVVVGDSKILKDGDTYDIFADKVLITKTNLSTPSIISVIEKLIDKDKDYLKLLSYKPRTIEELVEKINIINKGVVNKGGRRVK